MMIQRGDLQIMIRITYEKLKIKMVKSRLEWKDMKHIFGFSSHTIVKLKNDQNVNMDVILRICDYFKCDISEIMEVKYCDDEDLKL